MHFCGALCVALRGTISAASYVQYLFEKGFFVLDNIDFNVAPISKEEYKPEHKRLIDRLVVLQQKAHERGIGLVVLFEGWDGAGKGSRISDLLYNLDARATSVYVTPNNDQKTAEMFRRRHYEADDYHPMMAQFWEALGPRGNMTIYDRGWYTTMLQRLMFESSKKERNDLLSGNLKPKDKIYSALDSTKWFEQQLQADGYIIVKFFMHISKKSQQQRLERLATNPKTEWRVSADELTRIKDYKKAYRLFDAMIEKTDYDFAHWVVLNAEDGRRANLGIARTLVDVLERACNAAPDPAAEAAAARAQANSAGALVGDAAKVVQKEDATQVESAMAAGSLVDKENENADERSRSREAQEKAMQRNQQQAQRQSSFAPTSSAFHIQSGCPALESVDYHLHLSGSYHDELKYEQKRLYNNELRMYLRRLPLMLVFEGWDAAGKGGAIKRIAQALDARSYTIFPSPAPTKPELMHPFLWRYWTRLPKAGHVGIYDRSWYGRVLVERVEGFASTNEWSRAYDEINEFEKDLANWGAVIVKFWVEVDRDEQLARFEAREKNPDKQWKITSEDWRNRDKYPQYYAAVEDMFRLTSTDFAPWTILESNDKHYARVKALRSINEALEKRLGKSK